jgi:hypothetical protein
MFIYVNQCMSRIDDFGMCKGKSNMHLKRFYFIRVLDDCIEDRKMKWLSFKK